MSDIPSATTKTLGHPRDRLAHQASPVGNGHASTPGASLLERFFHSAPDAFCILNRDGSFKGVNPAFEAALGYPADQLAPLTFIDLVHPEDVEATRTALAGLANGAGPRSFENNYRRKDGVYRWLHWTAAPDADCIFLTAHDVTARRQAEEIYLRRAVELEEATHFLDSVIENLPVMMFVKDAQDLRWLRWNKAGEDLIGYRREDLLGMSDYDFFPEEQAARSQATDREALDSGRMVDIPEESIQTATRGIRVLHTRKIPVLGADGQAKYLLGISEDITERRQSEAALAKRVLELETVARVSTAATHKLDVDELLQEVVALTQASFQLYHAHIYLLSEAGDSLVLAAGAGQAGQQMKAEGWSIPLDRDLSLVARAALSRQGVIVNDVAAEPGFLPNPLLPATRSEMAIPILVGEELLGVLDVQSAEVQHFGEQDVSIMTTLAAQVAVALQNARTFAQAQRMADREVLVNTITQRIQSATTVESALQIAARELGRALRAQRTLVQLGGAAPDSTPQDTPAGGPA